MSNDTEKHRFECEARHVLKHNKEWRNNFFAGVEKERGKKAANDLFDEVQRQYKLKQKSQELAL